MKWRLFRLRQRIKAWLGAAERDEQAAIQRRIWSLENDAAAWQRTLDDTLDMLYDRMKIMECQVRMLALRNAKTDIEKQDALHDA